VGIALLLVAGAFVAMVAACSNQGEGERCEVDNGDDDCRTGEGLSCYPEAQLKNAGSDRCCPRDRSKATHPVCKQSSNIDFDAAPPPDTGPPPPKTDAGDASDAAESPDGQ
jgi:hypothetical protein